MFTRKFQEAILEKERPTTHSGHDEGSESGGMTWTYRFVDSRRQHQDKPIVDVSAPFNALDETHRVRRFGVQKSLFGQQSLNELVGAKEDVPYTMTHHTFERCTQWTGLSIMAWTILAVGKAAVNGIYLGHPRNYHANAAWFYLNLVRFSVCTSIGVFGYFYSHEFLYTYVPGFKLVNPSLDSYRNPHKEGNTTYMARAAAALFPAAAVSLYAGTKRFFSMAYMAGLFGGFLFEYCRVWINPGMRMLYNVQADKALTREAQWGSLAQNLQHQLDPDTNKSTTASQYRYIRLTTGLLQDVVWENATTETLPLHPQSKRMDNPYFNWQKAPAHGKKPIRNKNDLWSLHPVLDARMMSGALDS